MAAAVARARGDTALAAELAARPVNPALDPPVQSSARGAEAWEASRRA
jgi:hypothetical protein